MNGILILLVVALPATIVLTVIAADHPVAYRIIQKGLKRFAGWLLALGIGYTTGHFVLFLLLQDYVDPKELEEIRKLSQTLFPPVGVGIAVFVCVAYLLFILALPSIVDARRRKIAARPRALVRS